jgi:DNA helicase-2/ATP-dependent DNA helicase PcrA
VLAVGDPDQSIYAFRGASSKIIGQYIKDYHVKLYTLSVNYRSSSAILYHANRLIRRNNRRYQNVLIPMNQGKQKVYSIQFSHEIEEAATLILLIKKLLKQKIRSEEIAILYRNHQRSFELQKTMREFDIPFQTFDENNNEEKHGIQMMTIHKAKGLEFDAVIIIGLEMGVLPSSHDNRQLERDEERRLMFVAMTRARDHLYFSSIQKDTLYHTFTSSVFISESGLKTIKNKEINGIISIGEIT